MTLPIVTYKQLDLGLHQAQCAISGTEVAGLETLTPGLSFSSSEIIAQLSTSMYKLERASGAAGVMVSVQDQFTSLLQTFLSEKASQANLVVDNDQGGLEVKFDRYDISGWVGSFFTWWKKISPHPLIPGNQQPTAIGNKFRTAVLGDWGTGLYGAPACAESITKDSRGFQLLLHLGDVYYSGDQNEIRDRLLKLWPSVDGALSRFLNGNHEMYTGGHAYFEQALPFANQPSSYFFFQNDYWNLIALDSAYKEHDLTDDQVAWVDHILDNSGDRKTVLFSHHQPFSLLDEQGPLLVERLSRHLEAKKIFAWYWGHEHRCAIYDHHPRWHLYGRCVGHGGYPYFRGNFGPAPEKPTFHGIAGKNFVPGAQILDGCNPYIVGHEIEYGPHGYLTLELADEHLYEEVFVPDGDSVYQRQLS